MAKANHLPSARIQSAIDAEWDRFASASPIARGPAELSHSVLRVLENDDYLKGTVADRIGLNRVRNAFVSLIGNSLGQHARDRGYTYRISDRSLSCLVGQLELWARLLSDDPAARKRIRTAVQLALAEELNANIFRL